MISNAIVNRLCARALLVLGVLAAAVSVARAELMIDITRGVVEPLPIAIIPFTGETPQDAQIGAQITEVIENDLRGSGLFRPLDRQAFIDAEASVNELPRFADWRLINAQALVQGRSTFLPDGRLQVEFRLWDVFAEQHMEGLAYVTAPDNWRRISHIVADAVYKRITGENGYFDTRIVYVAESGPFDRRIKRLAIMDQDGANHRYLTDGSSLVLTPRFSPSLQEITYLSYASGRPRVYVRDIDIGRQEVLGAFPGMTFAPRFSPDGEKLILSLAEGGNTDIYTVDLRTREKRRLTSSSAIDTSPSYAPDGRQIVFNSDRGGSQQLYVMDSDGANPRRISFGDGRYATPVWSPRGDLIAFTKIANNRFSIGVLRPDGSGERLLVEGYHVEGPTWAPNGRVLMFYRQDPVQADGSGGRSRLFVVDLTGRNEREIETPLDASDPSWSPLHP